VLDNRGDIPDWFARLIDERFNALEKLESEHMLDMARRMDWIERDGLRRMQDLSHRQDMMEALIHEVGKATPAIIERIGHLERVVYGATAMILTSALLYAGATFFAHPYETKRAVEYPTTPYRGPR
jgi:hypothetical protein